MMRSFLPAHPALRLLGCAVLGIVAGFVAPVWLVGWLVAAVLFCMVTGVLLLVNRNRPPSSSPSFLSSLFYLSMVFAAFAFHASSTFSVVKSPSLLSWAGREVIASGVVDGRPVESHGQARFRLRVQQVFEKGRTTPLDEPVKVGVRLARDGHLAIQEGDAVHVKGQVALIPKASNRGEFDARWHYRLQGVNCQLYCIGPWMVRTADSSSPFGSLRSFVNPLRNYLTSAIETRFPGGAQQGFIKGMMLGEREMVDQELYDAFRLTGTAHVLVVSGLHVALLAYVVNLALQRLRVTTAGKWLALFIIIAVIALYSFVTGNAPSTRRAAIMASVIVAGGTVGRKSYALNSLAAADLIILLFNPLELFSPGFQMTNGAVVGILLIYPHLSRLVPEGDGVWRKSAHWLWGAFSVSLSAMIGISPVIAWYFGTYSPSGIIANVPVVFFSSMAMYAALPMVLFHGVGGGVAELFGLSSWLFAHIALWFVELFSRLPLASIEVHPSLFGVVVFYLTVALALVSINSKAWGRLAVVVLFSLNLLIWHGLLRAVPASPTMVTVNGGRDVAMLLSSGSETMLVEDGRHPMERERISQQAERWGLATPIAAAGVVASASDERLQPVAGSAARLSGSHSFIVQRPAERVLRVESKRRSWLFVSGLKRLEEAQAEGGDVALWISRFSDKEWRWLDAWIASARPRRMLLIPVSFMPRVQRGLLERFAEMHQAVEVRSKSEQTAWY